MVTAVFEPTASALTSLATPSCADTTTLLLHALIRDGSAETENTGRDDIRATGRRGDAGPRFAHGEQIGRARSLP